MMNPMTETYLLASKARAKLTKEASRPDHDLRVLVAHANMLDSLMDRIHEHRTSLLNGDYLSKRLQFSDFGPSITQVSYIEEEDEDDDDFGRTNRHEIHYNASEVEYDSDSDSDEEFDIDSDEDEELLEYTYEHYTSSRKFREMPSMDDLTEDELDDLEQLDSASETEEEEEEVDIADLRKTPSLCYTDESESEDEDEEHHHHHTRHRHHPLDSKLSNGNLMLENLTMVHSNFSASQIVAV